MMSMLLAVFLSAAAVLVLSGDTGRFTLRRRGLSVIHIPISNPLGTSHGRPPERRDVRSRFRIRPAGATFAIVAAVAILAALADVLMPAVTVLPAALLTVRTHRERVRKRMADRNRAQVAALLMDFTAELRAGRGPTEALGLVASGNRHGDTSEQSLFGVLAEVARVRGDVPAALRFTARLPGASALARLAPCWQVAEHQGSGLAAAAERLVRSLRQDEARRREVGSQLAAARATARLLAGLPVIAVLMGFGLGANPIEVLLQTSYGLACLAIGMALQVAGIRWTDRMAKSAEAAACR